MVTMDLFEVYLHETSLRHDPAVSAAVIRKDL